MRLRIASAVAVVAFCSLQLELVISRLSVFYLNYANAYLAIPLTLFGLALGSMWVHLRQQTVERLDLERYLVFLFAAILGSLLLVFLLFSQSFPIVHHYGVEMYSLLMVKTLVFVLAFLPPFFFAGTILTVLFTRYREFIGALYAADLIAAGAASALTPLLFAAFDIPVLVMVLALAAVAGLSLVQEKRRPVLLGALCAAAIAGGLWTGYFDDRYDLSHLGRRGEKVSEVSHRWNQFSRVSLLAFQAEGRNRPFYRLIHDNAESNVNVMPYDGRPREAGTWRETTDLPLRLGRKLDSALVVFAGCGAQMIQLDAYTSGKAKVTGVEINPLAQRIPAEAPALKGFRLQEFYDKPNVNLVISEGRHFLNRDEGKYDFIYAASDAPTSQYKTGHSRKYLDTYEAMSAYLDHLNEGGVIIFESQPLRHKVPSLRYLLEERGANPANSIIMLANQKVYRGEEHLHLFLSPSGFSDADVAAIRSAYPKKGIIYAPSQANPGGVGHPEFLKLMNEEKPPREALVTDDNPYIHKVNLDDYEAFPELSKLTHPKYYRTWIRVTTVLVLLLLVGLAFGFLFVSKTDKPPPSIFSFLLLTGFAYMLCQVSLIGKLELFLGSPLLSMALLLAMFLLSNGLGSSIIERVLKKVPIGPLVLFTAILALLTGVLVDVATATFIGAPLVVRILLSAILVAPLGVSLGFFYPFAVGWLTRSKYDSAVPVTFAISTLSSVLGASFAMLVVINTGYGSLLTQAAVIYAVVGLIFMVARKAFRLDAHIGG